MAGCKIYSSLLEINYKNDELSEITDARIIFFKNNLAVNYETYFLVCKIKPYSGVISLETSALEYSFIFNFI